jgi:transposase
MRQSYRTDLTDQQWELLQPLIPPAKKGGRPRTVDMRGIINGIFDLLVARIKFLNKFNGLCHSPTQPVKPSLIGFPKVSS